MITLIKNNQKYQIPLPRLPPGVLEEYLSKGYLVCYQTEVERVNPPKNPQRVEGLRINRQTRREADARKETKQESQIPPTVQILINQAQAYLKEVYQNE